LETYHTLYGGDQTPTPEEIIQIPAGDNQYLEMRAVSVTPKGVGKSQVFMELWAHNLEFAGFDVRFQYDNTKITLSSINTNLPTSDKTEFFKFESEFANSMEMLTVLSNEVGLDPSNTFRAAFSFSPNVVSGEHIKEKENVRWNAGYNK